jgi:phosphoglycolate phosphatase-like HAD superfamily hydrolase
MDHCYIFDIDGTLADLTHRLPFIQQTPKDWDGFFAACPGDRPISHVIQLAKDLAAANALICYLSGRSDQVRDETIAWLADHGCPSGKLFMRKAGDHRPDHQMKTELLEALRAEGFEPIMVFDDRASVVKMWREIGVPCAQVAEGDF